MGCGDDSLPAVCLAPPLFWRRPDPVERASSWDMEPLLVQALWLPSQFLAALAALFNPLELIVGYAGAVSAARFSGQ